VDLDYDEYDDNKEEDEYWQWMKDWLEESYRVLEDGGAVAIVTPVTQQKKWLNLFDKIQLEHFDTVMWCRSNLLGFKASGYNHAVYPIYILAKGDHQVQSGDDVPRCAGVNSMNYIEEPAPQSNFSQGRVHPAQQPVKVYEKIILKDSPRDGIVVDPFMGSGTAGVAAKKCDRKFVGCDISEDYVNDAMERIESTTVKTRYNQQNLQQTS